MGGAAAALPLALPVLERFGDSARYGAGALFENDCLLEEASGLGDQNYGADDQEAHRSIMQRGIAANIDGPWNGPKVHATGSTILMRRLNCYPPAEVKIPATAFLAAIWPRGNRFATDLCQFLGVGRCTLANSGRALLYKLLAAAGRQHPKRREILMPGYTCYSVAAAAARAGMAIKPYDLKSDAFYPDLVGLKRMASDRTLAIVVQHLFGIPTPMVEIRRIADSSGAILIEDAAQALGGALDGRLLGTSGDFGLFSFGRGKPLPLGGGGALIGKDGSIPEFTRLNHRTTGMLPFAVSAAAQVASKPYVYRIAEMLPIGLGETVFEPNFEVSAMGSIMERLGSRSLASLPALNAHRDRLAGIYRSALPAKITIPLPAGARPVHTRFPVLAGPAPIPDELLRAGVRRMYPKALVDVQGIHPFLAPDSESTPGAARIARDLVTLPTHTGISEPMASLIADKISRYYS